MEGGVTIYARKSKNGQFTVEKKIFLSSVNPTLIQQYTQLIGLILKDVKLKYDKKSRNLYIKDKKGIEEFARKIGFLPRVKVSLTTSRWYGFEKKQSFRTCIMDKFKAPRILETIQIKRGDK
jgi:hypothetical protein